MLFVITKISVSRKTLQRATLRFELTHLHLIVPNSRVLIMNNDVLLILDFTIADYGMLFETMGNCFSFSLINESY